MILDLALKFNSTTKEQDVIITLSDAAKDGKLGEFSVGSIKGKKPDVKPTGECATSPPDGSSGGKFSYKCYASRLMNNLNLYLVESTNFFLFNTELVIGQCTKTVYVSCLCNWTACFI